MADSNEPKRPRIGYLAGGDHMTGFVDEEKILGNPGSTDLYHLRDRALDQWLRIQIPRNYLRIEPKYNFANFDILLNLITDPDQNPTTLKLLEKVLKHYKGRQLNRADAVLRATRDQVALALAGIDGLIVPKVARFVGKERVALSAIEKVGCSFPAILRSTGTHSGRIVGVMESAAALLRQIQPSESYFLTQFVNTRGADGLYRKMRVFFIGDTQVIRHWLISDQWNVHAADRTRFMAGKPALVAEERGLVEGGIAALPEKTRATLQQMKARMRLDFFGADLSLQDDGSLVLFEANPTMNFFPLSSDPQFAYLEIARKRAADAFAHMLYPTGIPRAAI